MSKPQAVLSLPLGASAAALLNVRVWSSHVEIWWLTRSVRMQAWICGLSVRSRDRENAADVVLGEELGRRGDAGGDSDEVVHGFLVA